MKKIIILLILFVASPAFADYTIELKNESDTIIRTYTITTNQVLHLQKAAAVTNTNVIDQFENAIYNLIVMAKSINKSMWLNNNGAYVEEQSRQ